MSLFQPISTHETSHHQGFPYGNVPISPADRPAPKTFSLVDVQALGLILMILMVVSMPVYRSVLARQGKQAPPAGKQENALTVQERQSRKAGRKENKKKEIEGKKFGIESRIALAPPR